MTPQSLSNPDTEYTVEGLPDDLNEKVRDELALCLESDRVLLSRVRAVVLVQQVNLPTAKAIAYAKASHATSLMEDPLNFCLQNSRTP